METSRASGKIAAEPWGVDALRKVGIVIVNYRTPELTATCLGSLRQERESLPGLKVIVVDGGSADGSVAKLADVVRQPEYRDWVELLGLVINGGFGWANNQAISHLLLGADPPDYVHLLNPDTEVEPDAARALVDYLDANPQVAVVGSQLLEPDGSWSGSAFSFPTVRGEFARGAGTGAIARLLKVPPLTVHPQRAQEVEWVTGASVMFRREALEQVGLFDEGFFLYHEEVELMWRMRRAGWAIATEPRSRVRHVGGVSTGVHTADGDQPQRPRRPSFWYRSRARFFGLTRGRVGSLAVFTAWLLGHGVWRVRRMLGLAARAKPLDHELRDVLTYARPRSVDFIPAVGRVQDPSKSPAWMAR